jgi:hypothetical protein
MQQNSLKPKTLSLGLIALSAISIATTAMEPGNETSGVSNLKNLFESPLKQTPVVSQVADDIKIASPVATRNIALHLKEEAEVRAAKEIETAKLMAQAEIEEIRKTVESIHVEADLEIKKIRESIELEKTKASQELEDLKQQKHQLEQELNAAKGDSLLTRSGIITAASYLNPWAYVNAKTQQNSNTEVKSIDQTNVEEGTQ